MKYRLDQKGRLMSLKFPYVRISLGDSGPLLESELRSSCVRDSLGGSAPLLESELRSSCGCTAVHLVRLQCILPLFYSD